MPDTRETTVRVLGVERVIRTERTTTVKALEAAHTKAVKAALIEMHAAATPRYAEQVRKMNRDAVIAETRRMHDYYTVQKLVSRNPGAAGTNALRERLVTRYERLKFNACSSEYASARRPFPPVRYAPVIPAGLVEVEPGHYTDEPAMLPAAA